MTEEFNDSNGKSVIGNGFNYNLNIKIEPGDHPHMWTFDISPVYNACEGTIGDYFKRISAEDLSSNIQNYALSTSFVTDLADLETYASNSHDDENNDECDMNGSNSDLSETEAANNESVCFKCGKNFNSLSLLRLHKYKCSFSCQMCGMIFNNVTAQKEHLKTENCDNTESLYKQKCLAITTNLNKTTVSVNIDEEKSFSKHQTAGKQSQTSRNIFSKIILAERSLTAIQLDKQRTVESVSNTSKNIINVALSSIKQPSITQNHPGLNEQYMQVLDGYNPHKCPYCLEALSSSIILIEHCKKYHHIEFEKLKCSHCPKSYSTLSSLSRHVRAYTGEMPFVCVLCRKKFSDQSACKRHINTNHKSKYSELQKLIVKPVVLISPIDVEKVTTTLKQKKRGTVPDIPEKNQTYFDVQDTMKDIRKFRYQCKQCKKICYCHAHFTKHMKLHNMDRKFACEFCSYRYRYPSDLKYHQLNIHGGKLSKRSKIQCEITTKKVTENQEQSNDTTGMLGEPLRNNSLTYTNNVQSTFQNTESLIKHDESSNFKSDTNRYISAAQINDQGDMNLSNASSKSDTISIQLDNIVASDSGVNTRHCNPRHKEDEQQLATNGIISIDSNTVDGTSFAHQTLTGNSLPLKKELNGKLLECPHCGDKFKFSFSLLRHLSFHSSRRPNQCKFCNKTFSSLYGLNVHCSLKHRKHIPTKPFQCTECKIEFSSRDSFRRHNKHYCKFRHTKYVSSSTTSEIASNKIINEYALEIQQKDLQLKKTLKTGVAKNLKAAVAKNSNEPVENPVEKSEGVQFMSKESCGFKFNKIKSPPISTTSPATKIKSSPLKTSHTACSHCGARILSVHFLRHVGKHLQTEMVDRQVSVGDSCKAIEPYHSESQDLDGEVCISCDNVAEPKKSPGCNISLNNMVSKNNGSENVTNDDIIEDCSHKKSRDLRIMQKSLLLLSDNHDVPLSYFSKRSTQLSDKTELLDETATVAKQKSKPTNNRKKRHKDKTENLFVQVESESETLKSYLIKHTGERKFECTTCGKCFNHRSNLTRHYSVHSKKQPHKCKLCGRKFKLRHNMVRHRKMHGNEDKKKAAQQTVTKHSKQEYTTSTNAPNGRSHNHKTESLSLKSESESKILGNECKPFKCNVCGKNFSKKEHLRRHGFIHTDIKPFECAECSKTFRYNYLLKRHLKTHTGEKPFQCTKCGKNFSKKEQLRRHGFIHTDIKPFECAECSKTFRYNYLLKRHLMTHTGEKPFECTKCGKCFSQRRHLVSHCSVHNEKQPYKCKICKKSFRQQSNMTRHKKIHKTL